MKKWFIGLVLLIALLAVGNASASTSFSYISGSSDGDFMLNIEIDDMGNIAVFDIPEYTKDAAIALIVEKGFAELIGQNISLAKIEVIPEAPDACEAINELIGMISAQVPWASSMLNSSGEICSACHSPSLRLRTSCPDTE